MHQPSVATLFPLMLSCCLAWTPRELAAQTTVPSESEALDYATEVNAWRMRDEERLNAPFGWLSLTGHYWLKEGANEIDSHEDDSHGESGSSKIPLPRDLSERAVGTFFVKGSIVEFSTPENSPIKVNGQSQSEVTLDIAGTEEETDGKDKISIGERIRLQLVRRNGRFAVRVRDSESPLRKQFTGKAWFEVEESFRVRATFTPYIPPKSISIVNIKGESVSSKVVGSLRFSINNREFVLDALSETPDSLFVIFKDLTNGDTTYSAGRFLYAKSPVNGEVILDFNKAYNPPCAFSPHTLCPVPPKQNHLDIAISAGERKYEAPDAH